VSRFEFWSPLTGKVTAAQTVDWLRFPVIPAGLSGKQELRNAKRPQRRTQTTGRLMEFASDEEYFVALRALIERWCDQRKLGALSRLLPGYLSSNGLTDGWANLYESPEIDPWPRLQGFQCCRLGLAQ
jgi:hypothetical protein